MECQRQEQENFLRAFTARQYEICTYMIDIHKISEVSGEIKGERLRFVEAMKEATAINVQGEQRVSRY